MERRGRDAEKPGRRAESPARDVERREGPAGRGSSRRRGTVFVSTLVVGFLGLLSFGLTRNPQDLPSALIDAEAPDFALSSMEDDRVVRLADHRGEVVVVNFWASWCLACREEHAALSAAAEAYRERGVRFYGVLYQDTPANARRWIREMGGQSYPTLLDPGTRTAIDLGVYGVPETYFIDRAGRVAHKHLGPVTGEVLARRIGALLSREEPGGSVSPRSPGSEGSGPREASGRLEEFGSPGGGDPEGAGKAENRGGDR